MDDIDSLKRQINDLESRLEEQQKSHQAELTKIKTENYEALEASQTRYQGELEIQRTNFQKQVADLKAKLKSFEA
jgi:multidrug resistance efflux pump